MMEVFPIYFTFLYILILGCVVNAGKIKTEFVRVDGVQSELGNGSVKYNDANIGSNVSDVKSDSVVVRVEHGDVIGTTKVSVQDGKEYYAFFGIPYAKPPIGELRFRAPQPLEPWTGALVANRTDVSCWQRHLISKEIEGLEDCLILNVYTTKLPSSTTESPLLPVMVWIHGGGFESGSSSFNIYGPDYLIGENVVVVSINYRLGALGFLDLDDASVSPNAGLKDQVAALRWVQANIASFNGDPEQVTIFGQSAGAACVHMHLLSPMSKGLFHRAISQSGSALSPWAHTTSGHSRAMLLAKTIGCDKPTHEETVSCLRETPGYDIVDNSHNHTLTKEDERHNIFLPFVPTSELDDQNDDEPFLPDDPINILQSGNYNKVPHIIGVNSQETLMFLPLYATPDIVTNMNKDFARMIPIDMKVKEGKQEEDFARRIKKYYFGTKPVSDRTIANLVNLTTDILFTNDIYKSVKIQTAVSKSPTYFYQFSFDGELGFMKRLVGQVQRPGATHADELGYLFNLSFWDLQLSLDAVERRIRHRMVRMWTNFAKTGNPSSELSPELTVTWVPSRANKIDYLSITSDLSMRTDLEHMAFWDQLYEDLENGIINENEEVTEVAGNSISSSSEMANVTYILLAALYLLNIIL